MSCTPHLITPKTHYFCLSFGALRRAIKLKRSNVIEQILKNCGLFGAVWMDGQQLNGFCWFLRFAQLDLWMFWYGLFLFDILHTSSLEFIEKENHKHFCKPAEGECLIL